MLPNDRMKADEPARATKARRSGCCAAVLFGCLATGCGSPVDPAGPDLLLEPIQIDSVDVLVMETAPPTVAAHVRGVVGDGCSALHSVVHKRSGSTVVITILRQRPRNAICTHVALLYDERILLVGPFPAGHYVLRVNEVERQFTTQ